MVDAVYDGRVDVLAAGCGDHDLFRATLEVRRSLFLGREQPRAFEHDVDAERGPRQLGRVLLRKNLDAVPVHHHRIAVDLDLARELAVHRVVTGQVRVGLRAAEVVKRNDREIVAFPAFVMRAKDIAADAAIAVDRDFDGHGCVLLEGLSHKETQRHGTRAGRISCSLRLVSRCQITCRTVATTFSTVKPKCLNSAPAGADSPNVSMPTIAPSSPT